MSQDFKAGDIVCLKSGSSDMVIEEINDAYIVCVIETSPGIINKYYLKPSVLEASKEKSRPSFNPVSVR